MLLFFLEPGFPFAAVLTAEKLMENIYDNTNVEHVSH